MLDNGGWSSDIICWLSFITRTMLPQWNYKISVVKVKFKTFIFFTIAKLHDTKYSLASNFYLLIGSSRTNKDKVLLNLLFFHITNIKAPIIRHQKCHLLELTDFCIKVCSYDLISKIKFITAWFVVMK